MESGRIRFGIIGCAEIARKLTRAIALSPSAVLIAVASRSADKARQFIAANRLSAADVAAYGSYEELLDDASVDAVYVPLPASLHVRWAVAAAGKGKHVLLEKPAAVCLSDLDRILEACCSNGVQFMDGTMWLHHPRTAKMKAALSDADLFGPIKMLHSSSTFSATTDFLQNNIRVKPDMDSLGALGDLGWYCISAILWAVDFRLPSTVTALPSLRLNPSGVIISCSAAFHWTEHDTVATFHCSFLSNVSMDLSVHGTKASLQLKDLAIPCQEDAATFDFTCGAKFTDLHIGWTRKPEEVAVQTHLPQEALMIEEFCRLVMSIRKHNCPPDSRWPQVTRKTQMLVDAVKSSIDLGFKPVKLP